jgi:hypothetical protein
MLCPVLHVNGKIQDEGEEFSVEKTILIYFHNFLFILISNYQ